MSEYKVELSATAEKQFRKLQRQVQLRLARVIKGLATDPRPRGCRRLQGYDDVYRVRAGIHRIIYSIEDRRLLIIMLKIGHRKDVYR
jgi:mRNA interferase RelE/StbE